MKRQASDLFFPHSGGPASGVGGVRVFAPAGPVPPAPPGHSWESLMGRALERARLAAAAGEIPVGAVIAAPDGTVLAEAGNAPVGLHDPTAHAEMTAIRAASRTLASPALSGCAVYASGHPCPMCMAAMRLSGISEVCYAYSNDDGTLWPLDGGDLCRSGKALRRTVDEDHL